MTLFFEVYAVDASSRRTMNGVDMRSRGTKSAYSVDAPSRCMKWMPEVDAPTRWTMSLALSVLCSLCKEDLKDGDEVHSISCGHVFHYACIQRTGSTECPECRFHYESTQKLVLTFNDSNANVDEQLQAELQSNETELRQLEQQYNKTKEELDQLKAAACTDSDIKKDFLALQKRYADVMDDKAQIECQNESLSLQIAAKTKQITSLKAAVAGMETTPTDSNLIMEHKIKILEQKLEHMTKELRLEVSNSVRLSIENVKLQNLADQYGATKVEHSTATPTTTTTSTATTTNNANKPKQKNAIKKENQKEKNQALAKNKLFVNTPDYFPSIVLKRFPSKHVRYPLAEVVVVFAAAIEVQLSVNDVSNVRVHEPRRANEPMLQNQVGLQIQFKTFQLKIDFLRNRSKVKNHPEYGSVLISEYMNESTHSLLSYAKTKLTALGFSISYHRGQIKALRNNKGPKGSTGLPRLCIENKEQVDDLVRSWPKDKENLKCSSSMLRSLRAEGTKEEKENDSNDEETDSHLSWNLSLE
uniref:RING-type domain-containing protein n=1 Tax=Glossina austeni TaxID=7395 RepID=A0A1A9VVS2_GLOAU